MRPLERLETAGLTQSILANLLEGCQILGPDYRYVYANEMAARFVRTNPEHLVGRPIADVYPGTEGAEMRAALRRCMEGRAPECLQHEMTLPDGTRRWFEFRFLPVPVGVAILSAEIAESRRSGITACASPMAGANSSIELLRKTGEQLEAIVGAAPAAIFSLDNEGRVSTWNAGAERLFGWTAEEAVGRPVPMVPERQSPSHEERRLRALAAESAPELEVEYGRKDGTLFWTCLSTAPLRDRDGNRVGTIAVATDASQRKQVERERDVALAFLRIANESTSTRDLVARAVRFFREECGFEAVGIRLSEGDDYPYFEVTGFSAEFVRKENSLCCRDSAGCIQRGVDSAPLLDCMCGNVIRGRVDPTKPFFTSQGAFWSNHVSQLAANTTEADRPARTRNRCVSQGYESVGLFPLPSGDGCLGLLQLNDRREGRFSAESVALYERFAGYLAVAVAKMRADEALTQSEARYRALVSNLQDVVAELEEGKARTRAIYEHLPNPAFVWKRANDGFVLSDFNEAARAITQNGVLEFVGQPPEALEAGIPQLTVDLHRCFQSRGSVRREADCKFSGSNKLGRFVLTYGLIPSDMVILHTEDVTEQRQAEEQLRLSQRLEAVGRLAGGVAHDFNNLLSVIISYADFAFESLRDPDPVREDIREIQKAGRRAETLTRQLLAFSRKQVLEPIVLNLNKIILDVETMLRRVLGEDIEIVPRLKEDVGTVQADPGQVEQVIMNLAVNARDAMPRGGKLTIETRDVDLDDLCAAQHAGVPPGSYVLLSVSDTGEGMDAGTREHIFEPFFTTKEKGKGTGLGLATVYGIVKQSGGNICVYSEVGHGTTFQVYLPRVDGAITATRRRPPSIAAAGCETVLIVEDEDAVRKLAERILRSTGYHVLSAGSGGDALLLCEKCVGAIDLLLTDVIMPQMSGRALAERLTKLTPNLRVVYMSGYTDDAIVHHGVLEPGMHFIGKPFSAADLAKKVRDVLDEVKCSMKQP